MPDAHRSLECALPEQQSDCRSQKRMWQSEVALPDDTGGWQDHLNLQDDSFPSVESVEADFAQFDEFKQAKLLADYLNGLEELHPEMWSNLSIEEKEEVFQRIERQFSEVAGRPEMKIEIEELSPGIHGFIDWRGKRIVINACLLSSDTPDDLRTSVKTLIHEGRHAYQLSNVVIKRTEPNIERFKAWTTNLQTGYKNAARFGFQAYYMQPIEVDARTFSENVVSQLKLGERSSLV